MGDIEQEGAAGLIYQSSFVGHCWDCAMSECSTFSFACRMPAVRFARLW
jgi:hypothetical protein